MWARFQCTLAWHRLTIVRHGCRTWPTQVDARRAGAIGRNRATPSTNGWRRSDHPAVVWRHPAAEPRRTTGPASEHGAAWGCESWIGTEVVSLFEHSGWCPGMPSGSRSTASSQTWRRRAWLLNLRGNVWHVCNWSLFHGAKTSWSSVSLHVWHVSNWRLFCMTRKHRITVLSMDEKRKPRRELKLSCHCWTQTCSSEEIAISWWHVLRLFSQTALDSRQWLTVTHMLPERKYSLNIHQNLLILLIGIAHEFFRRSRMIFGLKSDIVRNSKGFSRKSI